MKKLILKVQATDREKVVEALQELVSELQQFPSITNGLFPDNGEGFECDWDLFDVEEGSDIHSVEEACLRCQEYKNESS